MHFPKVLCKQCNNAESQPFDRAYDHFVQKVIDDPEFFRVRAKFNMLDIFPGDSSATRNLARYYMKNIGCRVAETGFEVPQQVVDFMNGADGMSNGAIVLYKDFSVFDQLKRAGTGGHYPYANRMHNPRSPDDGALRAFIAEIQDGPVGVIFWWDAITPLGTTFCSRQITHLRHRRELPYHELHQREWDRAAALQRALDESGATPTG